MRKLLYFAFAVLAIAACQEKKNTDTVAPVEEVEETADSTIYGECGDGTAMHTLELITLNGDKCDTLEIFINDEEGDEATLVEGGLYGGDRMAVTARKIDGEWVAQRVINLTSLLGKWTSIDKNFEIMEGGEVKSAVTSEENSWTAWRILNGQLLLNRDTFDIVGLGADSLELENRVGVFSYYRQNIKTQPSDSI